MEEAEELCERIGIISKGELRCVGKTKDLKDSFGEGYRLHINFTDLLSEENELLTKELQKRFNSKIVSQLDSRVIMKVDKNVVFECVRWIK